MFAIIIEIKVRVNKILIKFNLTVKKPNCLNEHGDRNGFLCKREVKSNERVISLNGCADRPPPNPADLCQESLNRKPSDLLGECDLYHYFSPVI